MEQIGKQTDMIYKCKNNILNWIGINWAMQTIYPSAANMDENGCASFLVNLEVNNGSTA